MNQDIGRTALATGAAQGIGTSTFKASARQGARVDVADLPEDHAQYITTRALNVDGGNWII